MSRWKMAGNLRPGDVFVDHEVLCLVHAVKRRAAGRRILLGKSIEGPTSESNPRFALNHWRYWPVRVRK